MPKIAPAVDASGGLAYWTLNPFQLPDDIRLHDGHTYRILWVDAQGRPLPPHGAPHLPALHFFLGPPDRDSTESTPTAAPFSFILRDITSAEVRAQAEAELVKLRIAEVRAQQRERLHQQQLAATEAQLRIDRELAERRQHERVAQAQAAKVQREDAEQRSAKQREEHAQLLKEHERAELRNGLIALGMQLGAPPLGILLATLIGLLKGERIGWAELRASALAVLMRWSAPSRAPVVHEESPAEAPAEGNPSPVADAQASSPHSVASGDQVPSPSQSTSTAPEPTVGTVATSEEPPRTEPAPDPLTPLPDHQPQHVNVEEHAANAEPQSAEPQPTDETPEPEGLSPIEEEELLAVMEHPGLTNALQNQLAAKSDPDVRAVLAVPDAERDLDELQRGWSAPSNAPVVHEKSPAEAPAERNPSSVADAQASSPHSVASGAQDPSPSQSTLTDSELTVDTLATSEDPPRTEPPAEQTTPPLDPPLQAVDTEEHTATAELQSAEPQPTDENLMPQGLRPLEEEELLAVMKHPGLTKALHNQLATKSDPAVRAILAVPDAERDLDEVQQALLARVTSNTVAMRWYVQTQRELSGKRWLFRGFDALPTSTPESSTVPSPLAAPSATAPTPALQPESPLPTTPTLNPDQLRWLVAVVIDPQKTAQFLYERRRIAAQTHSQPAPQEPQTDLSGDQRKTIRSLANDPGFCLELATHQQKFEDACRRDPDALFHLPAPFSSLHDSDRAWIRDGVSTDEKRAYLQYLRSRQAALLEGVPLPPHPQTRLSPKEQKLVRRVSRDLRAMAFVAQQVHPMDRQTSGERAGSASESRQSDRWQ